MASFTVTRNGVTREVRVNPGEDMNAAINAAFDAPAPVSLGEELLSSAGPVLPAIDPDAARQAALSEQFPEDIFPEIPSADDGVGTAAEENERRRQLRISEGRELTGAQSLRRKAGLAARVIPSFVAKTPASIADLAAQAGNLPLELIDFLGEKLFDDQKPTAKLPTGAVANVQQLLNRAFPEPETFGEKIIEGLGDLALPGVAAGATLAPKVVGRIGEGVQALGKSGIPFTRARAESAIPAVSPIPAVTRPAEGGRLARTFGPALPAAARPVPGVLENIGISAQQAPKTFAALEASGAGGATIGAELADDADAGPGARIASTIGGGLAGVLAPQTVVSGARRTARTVRNVIDDATSGQRRAAKTLQERVADPEATALKVREAPPEVLPARAAEEPKLQELEAKVLQDDPALQLKTAEDLVELETRSLDELADAFGPTSDKANFERVVIQRGAAPGFTVKPGQADEMLEEAAGSFNAAYDDAAGFPIRTEVAVIGENIPLQSKLANATLDTRVLAGNKVRKGVANFVDGLLTDVSRRGPQVGTAADVPLVQLGSEDLLGMRQILRQEIRDRAGPTASTKAKAEGKLLQNAADAVTETLESQLPEAAATALKDVDARYREFVTVQGAVLRSGDKGLTDTALRASIKSRESVGDVARGQTGELGRLAETGKDIRTTLGFGKKKGDPRATARITRNMTPEQLQVAKADLSDGLSTNATTGTTGRVDGKKLLAQLETNREVLKAGGFTDADFTRVDTIGKQLKLAQARSPGAVGQLVTDGTGVILNLLARVAGVKSGTRILDFFGGGGAGGSFVLASFGSRQMQNVMKGLTIDNGKKLVTAALRGDKIVVDGVERSLFDALMLKNTASLKRQALSARTIKAFLLAPTTLDSETEDK